MGMSVADVELLVTPEQLTSASSEMTNTLQRMKMCFDDMDQIIKATENYWMGDAGDMFRELYLSERPEIDESLARLSEHPRDLIEIAGNYIDTEKYLQSISEELPSDVIS